MNDARSALAFALREAIEQSPLTQDNISERTGISQSMLSRIQSGQTSVTTERLVALANLLGTTPSKFWARAEQADADGLVSAAPPPKKSAPTKGQKQIEAIQGAIYAIVAGVSNAEPSEAEVILRSLKGVPDHLQQPDGFVTQLIAVMESARKKRRGRKPSARK